MKRNRFKVVLIVLLTLLVISSVLMMCIGTYKVTAREVINTILGNGSKIQNTVILKTSRWEFPTCF